jgi:hypothetical protein
MHEFSLQLRPAWDFPLRPYVAAAVDPLRAQGVYAFAGASYTVEGEALELVTTLNVGTSQYAGLAYALQDITLSSRGQWQFADSGFYTALIASGAWSGRASTFYPYAGLSLGLKR